MVVMATFLALIFVVWLGFVSGMSEADRLVLYHANRKWPPVTPQSESSLYRTFAKTREADVCICVMRVCAWSNICVVYCFNS